MSVKRGMSGSHVSVSSRRSSRRRRDGGLAVGLMLYRRNVERAGGRSDDANREGNGWDTMRSP
jgi:hypothetical protein